MPYDSLESLVSEEKGNTGYVLRLGGYTVAGEYYSIEYELKYSSSRRSVPANYEGWFDGESIIWFEAGI